MRTFPVARFYERVNSRKLWRLEKKNETILKEIDEKQKLLDRLDAEREKLVATKV